MIKRVFVASATSFIISVSPAYAQSVPMVNPAPDACANFIGCMTQTGATFRASLAQMTQFFTMIQQGLTNLRTLPTMITNPQTYMGALNSMGKSVDPQQQVDRAATIVIQQAPNIAAIQQKANNDVAAAAGSLQGLKAIGEETAGVNTNTEILVNQGAMAQQADAKNRQEISRALLTAPPQWGPDY